MQLTQNAFAAASSKFGLICIIRVGGIRFGRFLKRFTYRQKWGLFSEI